MWITPGLWKTPSTKFAKFRVVLHRPVEAAGYIGNRPTHKSGLEVKAGSLRTGRQA